MSIEVHIFIFFGGTHFYVEIVFSGFGVELLDHKAAKFASLIAQLVKISLQCRRPQFDLR